MEEASEVGGKPRQPPPLLDDIKKKKKKLSAVSVSWLVVMKGLIGLGTKYLCVCFGNKSKALHM